MIREVKSPTTDVSSKDDSPPAEQHNKLTEEEQHIKDLEDAYHSGEEVPDEEFDIEW